MTTALEIAFERAMTNKIYSIAGNTVMYYPSFGPSKEIVIILDSGSQEFPSGFEAITAEQDTTATVQIADMPKPIRGERITDSENNVFTIDTYSRESNVEWRLELRQCHG